MYVLIVSAELSTIMTICFAPDCQHDSEAGTCRFHMFPQDESLLRKWISLIRYVPICIRVGTPHLYDEAISRFVRFFSK